MNGKLKREWTRTSEIGDHRCPESDAAITLRNLLPLGRVPTLREGPALVIPNREVETDPATRMSSTELAEEDRRTAMVALLD